MNRISKTFSNSEKVLIVYLTAGYPSNGLDEELALTAMDAGADILTIHIEGCTHLQRSVTEIRKLGMKAGVALNPHTPVTMLKNMAMSPCPNTSNPEKDLWEPLI